MTDETSLKDPKDMTFEEAMAELEQVVRQLEDGRVPLEQAIGSYERGAALKARCDDMLKGAKLKVEEIYKNKEGVIETKPSELQEIIDA